MVPLIFSKQGRARSFHFILVLFLLLNVIPIEHSWKADCVWCAATHDQPLFFRGHSVGFPFHWRIYGLFEYADRVTRFESVIMSEGILPNLFVLGSIILVDCGYRKLKAARAKR